MKSSRMYAAMRAEVATDNAAQRGPIEETRLKSPRSISPQWLLERAELPGVDLSRQTFVVGLEVRLPRV